MVKLQTYIYLGSVKFRTMCSLLLMTVSSVFSQSITKEIVNTAGNDMINEGIVLSWNIGTIVNTFIDEDYILEGIASDMGLEEIALEHADFNIYPNPFSKEITIKTPVEIGDLSMSLTDVNGRIVQQFILSIGVHTLELEYLTAGVYFVKVFGAQSGFLRTSRVVKLN